MVSSFVLIGYLNPSRKTELTHECHFGADCIDTVGTYECSCRKGYTGDGMMCENINECDADNPIHNCNIEAKCYDEIGYFACICNDGYHGDGFGDNGCIDVNECSTGVHTCLISEQCVNAVGSFSCDCKHGWFMFGDECLDRPECNTGSHECDDNENCHETPGGYRCSCKESGIQKRFRARTYQRSQAEIKNQQK